MKIVNTDNFGGDYPNEYFLNVPLCSLEQAEKICAVLNAIFCPEGGSPRWWKFVEDDYKLQPGFEP